MRPARKADNQAELQSGNRKGQRIEYSEQKAYGSLAPDKTSECGINVGKNGSDLRRMVARQPAIHLGNEMIPVCQQIEGDDGGNNQE
jgi:hypothetical protein